jgi:hypothetical protein
MGLGIDDVLEGVAVPAVLVGLGLVAEVQQERAAKAAELAAAATESAEA